MAETALIVGTLLIGRHRDIAGVTMVINQEMPTQLTLSLDPELAVEAGASLLRRGLGMLGKYDADTIEAVERIVSTLKATRQQHDEFTATH